MFTSVLTTTDVNLTMLNVYFLVMNIKSWGSHHHHKLVLFNVTNSFIIILLKNKLLESVWSMCDSTFFSKHIPLIYENQNGWISTYFVRLEKKNKTSKSISHYESLQYLKNTRNENCVDLLAVSWWGLWMYEYMNFDDAKEESNKAASKDFTKIVKISSELLEYWT